MTYYNNPPSFRSWDDPKSASWFLFQVNGGEISSIVARIDPSNHFPGSSPSASRLAFDEKLICFELGSAFKYEFLYLRSEVEEAQSWLASLRSCTPEEKAVHMAERQLQLRQMYQVGMLRYTGLNGC
jgi:hypothetical protein